MQETYIFCTFTTTKEPKFSQIRVVNVQKHTVSHWQTLSGNNNNNNNNNKLRGVGGCGRIRFRFGKSNTGAEDQTKNNPQIDKSEKATYATEPVAWPAKKSAVFGRAGYDISKSHDGHIVPVQLNVVGWRGGSLGRASDSRSKGPRFESRQEHKKQLWVFPSQKCANSLSVCPTPVCIYTHAQKWSRTHGKNPVVGRCSSMDYGNTKRPSKHRQVIAEQAFRTTWL